MISQDKYKWTLNDCRKADRSKGITTYLDLNFVIEQLLKGCYYCNDKDSRIGLDRIDNNKAHYKDNVLPCCSRCNYIRGSMPFEAWMEIVPYVKSAREKGFFGDWAKEPLKKRKGLDKISSDE